MHFRAPDDEAVRAALAAADFALVVSVHEEAPLATHLPVSYAADAGRLGTLRAHFARANPHWRALEAGAEALVVCLGPHGYVSPSWYLERSVPTWDYVAVHAWCTPRLVEGDALAALLAELMDRNEARAGTGMRYADYPADYVAKMQRAIVGVDFEIQRLEAAFKLSQNRSAAERESVCAHLRAAHDPAQAALAAAIERLSPKG